MEDFIGVDKVFDYGLFLRDIIITLYAILLFRANLSRLYGNHSPLDFIFYIILGAIFGEAIVNNIPLIPSMIVSGLIVFIYRFLAFLTYKSHRIGKYIKGEKIIIIENGKYLEENLRKSRLTENDILQALRVQYGLKTIKKIEGAILERGGQISFFKKEN